VLICSLVEPAFVVLKSAGVTSGRAAGVGAATGAAWGTFATACFFAQATFKPPSVTTDGTIMYRRLCMLELTSKPHIPRLQQASHTLEPVVFLLPVWRSGACPASTISLD